MDIQHQGDGEVGRCGGSKKSQRESKEAEMNKPFAMDD